METAVLKNGRVFCSGFAKDLLRKISLKGKFFMVWL